ncbi:AAA family ATPase [Thauera linaloolentis]|uniref:AAA family ATPase n=1 Tax=Thauera linaloolentis TaxID=76112 RepID=UPI0012FBB261|nr:ATP-binding protein [Thauera linaloolentis]MCM8566297.1 ATP-binding protein [Thauera linaloolentis]
MAADKLTKAQELAQTFSPSAPIDQQSLFSGRVTQLMDVINAVNQKGQHAILFGERGVGKTSLARVISSLVQHSGSMIVASINCDPMMTFSSLWHKVLEDTSVTTKMSQLGFTGDMKVERSSLSQFLPAEITPDDVRRLFSRVGKCLIVIDELDRLEDEVATTLLADTIKTLSDHAIDATLLLVGVADSVDALISEHQSIERALVQIRMPRMSKAELFEIIDKGLRSVDMSITPDAKERIAVISQGLPHFTHLLSLYAAQDAVSSDESKIKVSHVRKAIDSSMDKAQQSIIGAYHKATNSPRENLYPQVLLACALAPQDGLGYFAAVEVRPYLTKIMRKEYDIPAFSQHLNKFCENDRGPVLQRTGTARRYRFRFINPLLQPFVIMNGIKKGLITESEVETPVA